MALRAKKPEMNTKQPRVKMMISGKAGAGKTFFALDFPSVYFIDSEGGAIRDQYKKKLIENNALYMGKEDGSQNFRTVIDEIKALATTEHDRKSLVIDSFSKLYNLEASIAEEKLGNDFGKDKKEANRPSRQLIRRIDNIDMNIILICHQKDKWTRQGTEIINVGTTFDGFDKMEFDLDLWIEVQKNPKGRTFIVKKSRIESLPEGFEFPLEYSKFADIYGKDTIEKASIPVNLATPEQLTKLEDLLKVVNVPEEKRQEWLTKCGVDKFEEMTSDQVQKCVDYTQKLLDKVMPPAAPKKTTKVEVVA